MNQPKQIKSSSIFLLELILAIAFFSIASAVCVQIFVKSHLLSKSAQSLNFAVSESCNIAEILTTTSSSEQIPSRLCSIYPNTDTDSFPIITLYYTMDFASCDKWDANYQLTISFQDLASSISKDAKPYSTFQALISFEDIISQEEIYALNVTHHCSQEVKK